MNPTFSPRRATAIFGSSLLIVTAFFTTGCYTQLASNEGDYWGYTGQPKKVEKRTVVIHESAPDTVVIRKAVAQATAPDRVDTVIVDDNRTLATNGTQDQTIINNYYIEDYHRRWGDDYWYDYWHRPAFGVTVSFGYPYHYSRWYRHHYYDPYYSSWYDPYDNWYHRSYYGPGWAMYDPYYGYPPSPFYGCYAPAYDPYYYDWNRPWYGGRNGFASTTPAGRPRKSGRITTGDDRVRGSANTNPGSGAIAVNNTPANGLSIGSRTPVATMPSAKTTSDAGAVYRATSQDNKQAIGTDTRTVRGSMNNGPVASAPPSVGTAVTLNPGSSSNTTGAVAPAAPAANASSLTSTGSESSRRVVYVHRDGSPASAPVSSGTATQSTRRREVVETRAAEPSTVDYGSSRRESSRTEYGSGSSSSEGRSSSGSTSTGSTSSSSSSSGGTSTSTRSSSSSSSSSGSGRGHSR